MCADAAASGFQLTPSRRATAEHLERARLVHFNSRPHGGRRYCSYRSIVCGYFNSRPHGGRLRSTYRLPLLRYFNSRPHGGRPMASREWIEKQTISTHALTEGDLSRDPRNAEKRAFQLTPSRRATHEQETIVPNHSISTHALTEGDKQALDYLIFPFHFNSRPHGGRPWVRLSIPK